MSETPPNTLQYRFDGPEDAPVLVLGPALGTTWHMWDRQVPELAEQWRVLRFDLPGHGGAPAHAAGSVAELADRLLATLDELGVQRFGYAGCCARRRHRRGAGAAPPRTGSPRSLWSRPRRGSARPTSAVSAASSSAANGLDPIARTAPERWFTPGFVAAQPAIIEWAVQMVRTTDPGCYIAACEALAAFDVRSELGRIGVPTLVVVGSEDQVTPPADARTLVAGIPDARLAVVPGASHLAPVEQPAAVTDLARPALLHRLAAPGRRDHRTLRTPGRPGQPVLAPPPAVPLAELEPGTPRTGAADRRDTYETGMKVRREVLGDAHVDRELAAATTSGDFQEFLTRYAWGEVWTRPGLDRRTRSSVTLTALVARGHLDELAAHTRAALRNGLTPQEIKEVLLQTAVYCGVPAANRAFTVAQRSDPRGDHSAGVTPDADGAAVPGTAADAIPPLGARAQGSPEVRPGRSRMGP